MHEKRKQELIEHAALLAAEGLAKQGDVIGMRVGDGFLITSDRKPCDALTQDDVAEIRFGEKTEGVAATMKAIFKNRKDIDAVVINHAKYCGAAADTLKVLPAVLDDFAQIVGPRIRTAKSDAEQDVLAALKGRNACLIPGGASIATGRTPDEAYTGALVLEKGAKAYIESTVLGGAIKIGGFDAALMRFEYKKKYSKKDQAAKKEELDV